MIEFKKVTATYRKNIGIFDISFKVHKGELIFLMGPTGAGKSTVLKAIYKDVPITDGSLYINGEDIRKTPKRLIPKFRRKIGMIFQDYRLIQDRTVYEVPENYKLAPMDQLDDINELLKLMVKRT